MALRILVTAFILLSAAASASDKKAESSDKKADPLSLSLSSYITGIDSDILVRMRVEPDARSRELTVEWVGDDLSGGAHAIMLNGDKAAASHLYTLKRLAPGNYVVTAILRRNDGSEIRRASRLSVIGMRGD